MTLLQSIDGLIDNISVTDRQEEDIKGSLSNLDSHLLDDENALHIDRTFPNGSYERDTILRPLDDIDVFAVLNIEKWKEETGELPAPQKVLTNLKNFLEKQDDYKGKVSQDRPCVTIELSKKGFDVLPCFPTFGGGYMIPNRDLTTWTFSYPEQLTGDLDAVHRERKYKVKQVIKVAKYWNRENNKHIPSYHIEEVAISIFTLNDFINFEAAIRLWFDNAGSYLSSVKFKSEDDYNSAISKINKVKRRLTDAKEKYDADKEAEAVEIWKCIFGREFPTVSAEEAKAFSKSLSAGTLKIGATGLLSATAGAPIPASKGFYGDVSTL